MIRRYPLLSIALLSLTVILGCATSGGGGLGEDAPASSASAASPIAYARGAAVYLEDLRRPLLSEAGGQALADWVLDRELARELGQRGLALKQADVDAERRAMLATLSPDENEAARLLRDLRDERGLDDASFDAFLQRSAALRKLVGEVDVSDAAVQQAYALRHGSRYAVRLLVVPTLREAQRVRERLAAGASFESLANESGEGGVRAMEGGGVLEPMSPADPSVPRAVASVLPTLQPGQVSDPLSVEGGFAVLKLERVVAGDGEAMDRARPELERLVRLRGQRVRMAELARELVAGAGVRVLDPTLERSWARQNGTQR